MTYPGQGDGSPWQQGQQPQPQQPGGWPANPGQYQQQPGYGQPGYPQQPYPGQQYQPQPGQPYPGQQPPGQPPYPPVQYPIGQVPPPKRRRGVLVGAVVAVVVLAGGGVGGWFAFHSGSTGSSSPQAAATKLVSDISSSDVVGIMNDLPPAEAALARDAFTGASQQLKRLNIIKQDAPDDSVSGLNIHTSGITFGASRTINDHLTITNLTAGRITVAQGMWTNELTDNFLHQAFPQGVPSGPSYTVDIAQEVRQLGHPIQIATVKVNGSWYPSLFYTLANAGLEYSGTAWPATSIPAVGASSADDAVRQFAQAALDADLRGVIERTAPDEMAVLHDVGPALVSAAGTGEPSGVHIQSIQFQDRNVTGGVDAVVRSMTLTDDGDSISLSQSGSCYLIHDQQAGQTKRFCASDLTNEFQQGSGDSGFGDDTAVLPPQVTKLLTDMVTSLMSDGVGVVATQVDGQWYVSPGRTITQLVLDLYGSISPSDLAALMQYSQQFAGGH